MNFKFGLTHEMNKLQLFFAWKIYNLVTSPFGFLAIIWFLIKHLLQNIHYSF